MRIPPLFLPTLAALLIALPTAARATRVSINSAETNTTWVSAKPSDRQLRWSPKDHALLAVVTFSDELHNGFYQNDTSDDLYFTFPGTQLNPQDHTIFVDSPDGPIAIGIWRQGMIGSHFSLFQNTLVIVHKLRGQISLTLDVDTERTAQAEQKKQDAEDTETYPLDEAVHKKDPAQ